MEFNFETSLIQNLRKATGSKLVLWCGILFAIPALIFTALTVYSGINLGESSLVFGAYSLFNTAISVSLFVIFSKSKAKQMPISDSVFTSCGILTLIGTVAVAALDIIYYGFVLFICKYLSSAYSSDLLTTYSFIGLAMPLVFGLIFSLVLFSLGFIARNNKPSAAASVIFSIIAFILTAFFIGGFVASFFIGTTSEVIRTVVTLISDGFATSVRPVVFLWAAIVITLPLFSAAVCLLCGIMGVKFSKISGRID